MIKRLGDLLFRYRNLIFPVVPVIVFIISPPDSVFPEGPLDTLLEGLGLVLMMTGEAFRLAVIGYAYIKRGGLEGKVYADHLVVKGFFAHCRNPLYLGTLTTMTGLVLLYESRLAYFFVLPFFLFAYYCIVVAEETFLRGKFGVEYEEYCRKVPRFWPDFRGLKGSLSEFKFDWKRALRKDYGNIFQTLFALWAIEFKKNFSDEKLPLYGAYFLLVLGVYCALRFLKKSSYLASSN